MRLRRGECTTLMETKVNPGGVYEAPGMESETGNSAKDGRATTLGPGLSMPSEMGKRTTADPQFSGGSR